MGEIPLDKCSLGTASQSGPHFPGPEIRLRSWTSQKIRIFTGEWRGFQFQGNEFVIFWKEFVAFPGSFVYNVQPGGVIPTCAEAIPLGTEKRKFW